MAKKRITLPKDFQDLLNKGDVEALKKVFDKCEVNAKTGKYGSNAFEMRPLPREFAQWLVEQGGDVNMKDYYGKAPIFIHASAYNGDVQLLLELGANAMELTDEMRTPLHEAAIYGRVEAAKALITAGADVNAVWIEKYWKERQETPLEAALVEDRVPKSMLLGVCKLLLENGAIISEKARAQVVKIAEEYEYRKYGIEDREFFEECETAMKELYKLFDVEPVKPIEIHDGVSPIIINEEGFVKQYNKMWEYLVPPNGQAKTVQGEVIRIAGKVAYEIMDNGGINWDADYKKMLTAMLQYLRLGNPLSEQDMSQVECLIKVMYSGNADKEPEELTVYAVKWVLANETVIPMTKPEYSR